MEVKVIRCVHKGLLKLLELEDIVDELNGPEDASVDRLSILLKGESRDKGVVR